MPAMSSTTHNIRFVFAIALLFVLAAVGLSYRNTARLLDTTRLVTRANVTITNLDGIIAALDNIERSRLAWVAAGNAMHDLRVRRFRDPACGRCHDPYTRPVEAEHFHDTHLEMVAGLIRYMQGLQTLIPLDDPAQTERFKLLESLVQEKAALSKEEIPSGKIGGPGNLQPTLLEAALLERDTHLTSQIRKLVADIEETESKLIERQMQEREAGSRREILAASLLGFLTICATILAYVAIHRGFARRKAMEEQLRQTVKMEAVGRLAGGVAHDFNNLLMPILWSAEMLRSDIGEDHPMIGYVDEIKKAGETASSVTRQLLAFSRKQTSQPQKLNLNTVATSMSNLLRRLVGDQYQIETVLEPALGWVEADPAQIEQVIMNLVLNARDAMPGGGIIAIETANVSLDGEKTCWHGSPLRGTYVVLAVSDDGVGMDAETSARVFEPFFTTKERGKGTGLGLATVYGIITGSDGRMRVHSAVGRGTAFEAYLPRVEQPAEIASSPKGRAKPGQAKSSGMRATVLLVEDDEAILRLLGNALAAGGYDLLKAHNGEEALMTAQACEKRIDLLISDVMMPRVNGIELQQKLQVLCPGLRTIFMSGYAAGSVNIESVLSRECLFLAKPFAPGDLLDKVGQLLAGTTRTKAT
ncbi:MAG: response regulator [Acidobacteriia bacterium]|nr:response regulator [Terriglobia bacterium]